LLCAIKTSLESRREVDVTSAPSFQKSWIMLGMGYLLIVPVAWWGMNPWKKARAQEAEKPASCPSMGHHEEDESTSPEFGEATRRFVRASFLEGRKTFRFDTFGDESFWGDTLKLHQAIEGAGLGGVGSGLSPKKALELGLKVDVAALPKDLVAALQAGKVDLDSPATTVSLLKLNAVVGLTGFFDASSPGLKSVGIQCALCHSVVDNSFAPGIGRRLDGWANRDLNVGEITALAPDLSALATILGTDQDTVRTVLRSWGPGKCDAELILDGKAFRPDGKSAATLLPPAFGLQGVNLHTWTGWGSVTHWNAFVANLEMHGKGTFFDPRLDNAEQFPIAAKNKFGHVTADPDEDRISPKLPALHYYQLSLPAPQPPPGSFDQAAFERGEKLFEGRAKCSTCHVEPKHTEPGWNLHSPDEIGIDDFQANRASDKRYRTSPLNGIWTHQKGGFYHDGRFPTLADVVQHYNQFFALGLADQDVQDIVQYLLGLGDKEPSPDPVQKDCHKSKK
jgi:cytochrome c peroxidase